MKYTIPITVRAKDSDTDPTVFLAIHSHLPASPVPISLISKVPTAESTMKRLPLAT